MDELIEEFCEILTSDYWGVFIGNYDYKTIPNYVILSYTDCDNDRIPTLAIHKMEDVKAEIIRLNKLISQGEYKNLKEAMHEEDTHFTF